MLWTLPNTLTVFRLLAAPVVALAFLALPRPHADWVALILFLGAALTDYADGRLARARDQVSRFGAMLDPIADKAMAVIALAMLLALQGATAVLVVPAVAILFREVFVSGLRGFLGDIAGKLNVTPLAKWKTLAQMLAIALLFAQGLLDHYFHAQIPGADRALAGQAPADGLADAAGPTALEYGLLGAHYGGLALLWAAAALTLFTGVDYFRKALPHLRA